MDQMHEIDLKLNDLRKTYLLPAPLLHRRGQGKPKTKQALAGVSITLGPGLYGLLGPNGAGKSTLIGIITGGLAADSGEVLWCGRPAHGIAFRRVLGYMPQQQGLYDSYTGRRFLAYMAALKEIPRAAVPGEVARVAAAVNLTDMELKSEQMRPCLEWLDGFSDRPAAPGRGEQGLCLPLDIGESGLWLLYLDSTFTDGPFAHLHQPELHTLSYLFASEVRLHSEARHRTDDQHQR